MRKILTFAVFLFLFTAPSFGQQAPMYTQYMFNSLAYNPAYAGSNGHMAIALLHRTQWWGIPGGPSTQSFTIHSPLKNERVGLGFSLIHDVIGPTKSIDANISYAYHIPMGKAKLSIALQGGAMNWRADWSKLDIDDVQDDAFSEVQPNLWLPNFGAGIYFYTKKFYLGFASPKLIEYDLRKENLNTSQWAKQYRHYYLSSGAALPLNGDALIFKPSILIKNVGLLSSFDKNPDYQSFGAPTEIDIDISFMFYQTLWIGASFRTAIEAFSGDSSSYDSVDIWAAYYLANGLRIGAAYDYSLSEIRQSAQGSFELMLGYEFNYITKQAVTPRYF